MPITKIKPTNVSNTGVYGISTGTDVTQNNRIDAAFSLANTLNAGATFTSNSGLFINSNTITSNIVITSGNNALSIGPITIANSYNVTVQSGSRWVVL